LSAQGLDIGWLMVEPVPRAVQVDDIRGSNDSLDPPDCNSHQAAIEQRMVVSPREGGRDCPFAWISS
jgi:hypothetical protein